MAAKEYGVVIRLVSNEKPCHTGHKPGDEWQFTYTTPEGMCSLAWNTIYPVALTLANGGTFPWQDDPDVIQIACPDAEVRNCFEIRRKTAN